MAWNDIDKKLGGTGIGRFITFEEGKTVQMRILDEEPFTSRVHKISQPVMKGGQIEEVFRSIPATANPDDNYILQHQPKRYPEALMFSMRAFVYGRDEKGKATEVGGEVKILQGGPAIFKPLQALYNEHGHLNGFDVTIARTGKGRDTSYIVSASPKSFPLGVDATTMKMKEDTDLILTNVFQEINGIQQKKMFDDAGFDITYDPASEIAGKMEWDEAKNIPFGFGKYKGKKVSEIVITDASYVSWASENITSDDTLAAACQVAVKHMAAITDGTAPQKQIEEPKTNKPAAAKPVTKAAPKEDEKKRNALIEQIGDIFEQDTKYEDIQVMVEVIKKHGNGKTRVRDLNITQMEALYEEVKPDGSGE